jgi:methylthioribose-1-phosphate isomerase
VRNWGFDVTPARLVSGFITERGVISAAPFAISQTVPA